MKIEVFCEQQLLIKKAEIEKALYLAYYLIEIKKENEFTVNNIADLLFTLGFARPNLTRLKNKIKNSKWFVSGSKKDFYRVSPLKIREIRSSLPALSLSDSINSDNTILPEDLFVETNRPYLLKLAKQINATYEYNLFDACAMIMRRLLEVMLIHCFEAKNIENLVLDKDDNYKNLKTLISTAIIENKIKLSNDAKKDMDIFRELGNLSAHRVKYNCRRDDISKTKLKYRAIIEELIYIANLIKSKN